MDVPISSMIIDNRKINDFKILTFNGYKKTEVIKELQNAILNQILEDSCYWYCELHISGQLRELWKIIFTISFKNINFDNPFLFEWLIFKHIKYQKLILQYQKGFEYESRNNQEIRNLLIDVITIITLSNKNKRFLDLPKIKVHDFYEEKMANKVILNVLISDGIIYNDEDKELRTAIKQIYHHLSQQMTKFEDLLYWYCWIEALEKLKKQNKLTFYIKKRKINNIKERHYRNWNWIIWKIILKIGGKTNEINMLYEFYKKNIGKPYSKFIIFNAFYLIKFNDHNLFNKPLIETYETRIKACINVNELYLAKKNENSVESSAGEQKIIINDKKYDVNNELYAEEVKKDMIKKEEETVNILNEIITNKPKIKKIKEIKPQTLTKKKQKQIIIEKNQQKIMEKMDIFNNLICTKEGGVLPPFETPKRGTNSSYEEESDF